MDLSRYSLYPHLSAGVQFLAQRGQKNLADDMVLGKTRQAILKLNEAAPSGVVWPVDIYIKGKDLLSKKGSTALHEEREFAAERAYLHKPRTAPQIDAREVVEDPLDAVPNLPFGHLNADSKTFMEGFAADEDLWSFTAPWQTTWGRKEIRTGYVVVHGGSLVKHFLTMWKEIENEPIDVEAPRAVSADGARLSSLQEGFGYAQH